jgi:signal transduction histidine kinase
MASERDAPTEIHAAELRERISWLIRLRWLATAGVAVTVSAAPKLLEVRLAEPPLAALTAGLVVYNSILWVASRRLLSEKSFGSLGLFASIQIGVDWLFLTGLLHFSGGIENPFVAYYVFHVVIASILLSRRAVYAHAAIAIGLFSLVCWLEAVGLLRHYHLGWYMGPDVYRSLFHVLGMLFVVATTLGFTAFMATAITAELRRRQREVMDLSESLKDHADHLENAYRALADLERGKSEYLLRVAHDLRSPLVTIDRMLSVVAEGRTGPLTPRSRQMVDRVRERVRQMAELARDLLALSRAREARPLAQHQKVDLAEVVAAVSADCRPRAAAVSVSLESEVDSGLPPVTGDRDALAELLENLLSNAVKYTPAGGRVRVAARRRGDEVELSVSDTGIGIPEGEVQEVFEDFYRASNARETGQEGTGLGLSIVQAIAKAHGGEIWVESEVGAGATFRVVLPASAG